MMAAHSKCRVSVTRSKQVNKNSPNKKVHNIRWYKKNTRQARDGFASVMQWHDW